jgi:predicted DNA-binding protein
MAKTITRTSIRLPEEIDEKLRTFAATHAVTKTKVILTALSHYLNADWGINITGRLTDVEQRLAKLENQNVKPST